MAQSLAQNAIALLIDLAEQGEINPWDVQVIDVVDRFLSELAPVDVGDQAAYEVRLSESGQAFLYASMLVLLKADSLARLETLVEEEAEALMAADWLEAEIPVTGLPRHLEQQLQRRAVAPPPQKRQVTLSELITQLEVMANALDEKHVCPRSRKTRPQRPSQTVRTIAQLAHQENLVAMAAQLEIFLEHQWLELGNPDWLDFQEMQDRWFQAQDSFGGKDPVGSFWALLLLSAQSKVELRQERFYQDLKLRWLPSVDSWDDYLQAELKDGSRISGPDSSSGIL